MSSTAKFLTTLAIIVVVAGAVIWLGWLRGGAPAPQTESSSSSETEIRPVRTNTSRFFPRATTAQNPATNVAVAVPTEASTNVITNWEDRVDQILGDSTEVEEKARKMLELLPQFPEAGQIEAAQHIANLLADEDYEKFGRYLVNPKTAVEVQDIILADVLNRPNEIKLPLLLQTARTAGNAKAADAKEILELYLEEDYGNDWDRWQQEMIKWLKENPD